MKIVNRSKIVRNLILFLLFSVFYIHILTSLDRGFSSFDFRRFVFYLQENYLLAISTVVISWTVYRLKRVSRVMIFLFFIYVIHQGFGIFLGKFDKIILVLNLFYILTAFYIYIFWDLELKDVIYVPGFGKNDIIKGGLYSLSVSVIDDEGGSIRGNLTNWDKTGCFILFEDVVTFKNSVVDVRIDFEGKRFMAKGKIFTLFDNGVGVNFNYNEDFNIDEGNEDYTWNDFYQILFDRSYIPLSTKDV